MATYTLTLPSGATSGTYYANPTKAGSFVMSTTAAAAGYSFNVTSGAFAALSDKAADVVTLSGFASLKSISGASAPGTITISTTKNEFTTNKATAVTGNGSDKFTLTTATTGTTITVVKAADMTLAAGAGHTIVYNESDGTNIAQAFTLKASSTVTVTDTAAGAPLVSMDSTDSLDVAAGKTLGVIGTASGTITLANNGATTLNYYASASATSVQESVKLKAASINAVTAELGVNGIVLTGTTGDEIDAITGTLDVNAKTADVVVGDVTFTNASSAIGTVANGNVVTLTNANGVVTVGNGKAVTLNTVGYLSETNATFTHLTGGDVLSNGSARLTNTYSALKVGTSNETQVSIVKLATGTDGVVVAGNADGSLATVTDLEAGEEVKIGDWTYTAISNTMVKGTDGTNTHYWTNSGAAATFKSDGTSSLGAWNTGSVISVADVTGTKYYNEIGLELPNSTGAVVTVDASNKKVTVTSKVGKTTGVPIINMVGADYTVDDKSTGSDYRIVGGGSPVDIQATSFSLNSDGALTKASGTVTVTLGSLVVANSNAGAATIDINQTSAVDVTYSAGANLNNAKIVTAAGTLTIKETQGTSATETNIVKAGNIIGLDAGAVVTGLVGTAGSHQTVGTAGNGTFTLNGTAWTVAGSENGVTLEYDTKVLTKISGLDVDESVTTTAKFTGSIDTAGAGGGKNFNAIKAQSGLTVTGTAGNGTLTLYAAKDTATETNSTNVYTVNAVGSAKDGIAVGDNVMSALTDGDKVTVTKGTETCVYEVSGKAMIVTYTDTATPANNATTAYTLTDDTDTAFTVTAALTGTVGNGTAGTAITAKIAQTGITSSDVTSIVNGVYVNADGSLTFSKSNAIGQITETDDLIKYDSTSAKAQTVSVAAGNAGNKDWYITTGSGKDWVEFTASQNVSINSGAGNDSIVADGTGDKILYTGEGNNYVTLSAGAAGSTKISLGSGNDNVTIGGAITGDLAITATDGKNYIDVHGAALDDITIVGGSGNDTIFAANAENVVKGNGGNNTYILDNGTSSASIKISDYTFGKDAIVTSTSGTTPSVTTSNLTADGKISLGAGVEADISATAGSFYAATIVDASGKKTSNIAWAKDGAAKLDTSSFSKDANLFGNEDGSNYLVSGAGKDVIHSYGDNDTVYGGAGDDSYVLSGSKTGRVVGFATTSGKDAVSGFQAKFEEGDSIYMLDGSLTSLKGGFNATAGTATLKSGSAQLTFTGITASNTTNAAEFVINGKKVAAIGSGATASVSSASYADVFMGDDSIVDFSTTDGDLYVDLSNDLSASGSGAKFIGIHTVTGGAGKSTLIGSAKDDSIVAGTGGSSLYGGKGKDTLIGNSDVADSFFIGSGSGTSTIVGFQTADQDTADTFGVLSGNITAAKLTSAGIEISSDSSKAVITSLVNGTVGANTMVKVAANNFNGVAKIGSASSSNSFVFDKTVGFYGGGSAEDNLSVDSSNTENAQVWLDGSQGVAYTSVDVVDFSSGSADYILAGDSAKNTISGGTGNNSLWGGAGNSVDVLSSNNSGTTMFWYGKGEGNDIINANSSNDVVNLYNISLADVSGSTTITGSGVDLVLNDGTKVTVNTGSNNVRFNLASGESYVANQSTRNWEA